MSKTKFSKTRPKKGESRTEYDETKERCNLTLTPTAIASGTAAADSLGISRSELIERLLRKGDTWLIDAVSEPLGKILESGTLVQYEFYADCNKTKHIVELDAALTEEEVEEEFISWQSGFVDSYWRRLDGDD